MLTIMSQKEYDSIMNREIVRDSDIVIVADKGNIKVAKNKFGSTKELIYEIEIWAMIEAYLKLVS